MRLLTTKSGTTDDAAQGEMNITVRAADGAEQKETIRYDPDTGAIVKQKGN